MRKLTWIWIGLGGLALAGCVVVPGENEGGDGDGDGVPLDENGNPILPGATGGTGDPGVGGTGDPGVGGTGGIGASTGGGGPGSGGAGGGEACVPVVDRCDCVVAADGVNSLIDAFEDADARINVIDGRDGEWFQATGRESGSPLGTMEVQDAALHLSGGATTLSPAMGQPDDWATFGVPLGQCYDASPYAGFKFRIKGVATGPSVNNSVRFSISTPPTTEVASGGSCPDGDLGCYNHFGKTIILTTEWQEVTATWAELTQGSWGIQAPPGYDKAAHIMAINFAPLENTKSYEFWIDDIQFTSSGGGDCSDLMSEATFNSMFPSRNGFYTYAGFVEAAQQFPGFCGEGTEDDRKRDVAALFAHTIQETGGNVTDPTTGLTHVTELDQSNAYCDAGRADFPCAGGQKYFGRGPLQLSWNYNYGTAGTALGLPLLANPGLVASSSANAFKAAFWFWMTRQPINSPHSLIVTGEGFGATTRLINGALECDGKQPQKVANRAAAFAHFGGLLGLSINASDPSNLCN